MARARTDKTPEEIRFLLNRQGLHFADIDRQFGLPEGTARAAVRRPHLAGELAIAEALSLSPRQIWPRRYDPLTGERLRPQPPANYTAPRRYHTSQKRRAA